jgi:hypothetical protein
MDRSDEGKDRVGDVLGLGNISPQPTDVDRRPLERGEESQQARRHHRMQEGADRILNRREEPAGHPGATSVDMGAGGQGTDIEE